MKQLFLFFLIPSLLCIPLKAESSSLSPPGEEKSDQQKINRKKALFFLMGTAITITAGLLISGADTGDSAPSSS